MLIALLAAIAIAASVLGFVLIRAALARRAMPNGEAMLLGAVTNFFDTLGIGSFAPTMVWLRFRRLVPDRLIPQTMIVGHTPPSIAQAIIFLILLGVLVDPFLLVGCAVALFLGAIVGAPLVTHARVWLIQFVIACALLVAGFFYALSNLGLMPIGGDAASLPLALTLVAIAANFVFGVLLNFGVGTYAPTLAMLSLMGMDPRLSFPIMAGGAALAGAAAATRHVLIGEIDMRIATGIALGGVPAVLVAAFVVKEMPIEMLRWLVIVVVVYAALVMLHAAAKNFRETAPTPTPAPGRKPEDAFHL